MALNALEHALRVPLVWTAEETDLMLNAFTEAHEQRGRGIRESLFAAAAALLRSRQKDAGIHTRMEGDRRLMIANRRALSRPVATTRPAAAVSQQSAFLC